MPSARSRLVWVCVLVAGLVFALGMFVARGGSANLGFGELWRALTTGDTGDVASVVLWRIRLPRAGAALLCGVGLGMIGAAFQAIFRNPLAEPYVLGVSSGAAAGGTLALLAGYGSGLVLVGASTVGGVLALGLVFGLAGRAARRGNGLILAGVVVGTLLAAVTTLNLSLAGVDAARMLRWLLGSTTPMDWPRIAAMLAGTVLAGVTLMVLAPKLDALAFGDEEAQSVGVRVGAVRGWALGAGSLAVGAYVGAVGIIGFVGLVAPHIGRRLVGATMVWLVPVSGLVGGILMLGADVLAQQLRPGFELPLGVVTAILGAPALLWLMRRAR